MLSLLKESIVAIECRDAVRFGHRRVIEGSIDEVFERIVGVGLFHNGLADVDDFRCVRAEAMDTEDF
jgi:hypothetical protein